MIGVRDDYKNPNNETVDDWWNISPDRMYELKPNERTIKTIDGIPLDEVIDSTNYKEKLNKLFGLQEMKL